MAVSSGPVTGSLRRDDGLLRRIVTHRADYAYVLPALVVMMVVIAYPIWFTVDMSFYKTPASLQLRDRTFVGWKNYHTILTAPAFWSVTLNTLIWTVASTFFAFLLGLGAALSLHREFAGRAVLRAILLIPYVISAVAASYLWKWLYHSDFGVIGALSVQWGFTDKPINFLDNIHTALPS